MKTQRARWVFWTGVTVLIVIPWSIGMVRMLKGGRGQPAAVAVDKPALPISSAAASATASAFVAEYLSFDPADVNALNSRSERLKAYLVTEPYAGLIPAKDVKAQSVLQTWAYGHQSAVADGTRGTILVQALVAVKGGPTRSLFVAVPVATDGAGRWAVDGLPRFVAAPGLATTSRGEAAEALPDPDGSIRAMLAGFLKAYISGAPAEIGVYMAPDTPVPTGLSQTVRAQFRELNEVRLFTVTAQEARADVVATLIDPETGAAFRQGFRLVLTRTGGRWEIARLD